MEIDIQNLSALQTLKSEYEKLKDKYSKKAAKEREKVNDIYVTVCGEKCYTEQEINDWYAGDYITCKQSDEYIEKLNKKREKAGQKNFLTDSERVCRILDNALNNICQEIHDIKTAEEREDKKKEMWEQIYKNAETVYRNANDKALHKKNKY